MINSKNGIFKDNASLRRAVVYAINQNQFIKFYRGDKFRIASPVTPLLDTGNKQHQDLNIVEQEMNKK